jgi:hypothetical protein
MAAGRCAISLLPSAAIVAGSVLVSTTTSSSFLPSTPPVALICSTFSLAPFTVGMSSEARSPVRFAGMAMPIVSSAARAGAATMPRSDNPIAANRLLLIALSRPRWFGFDTGEM